jgi:hypothetical protein
VSAIVKLAMISIILGFASLLPFYYLAQPATSVFYFGFPLFWYVSGVADMVGSFHYLFLLNGLKDVGLWSAIAFSALLGFRKFSTYRMKYKFFYLSVPFAALSILFFFRFFMNYVNYGSRWTDIFGWNAVCGSQAYFSCPFAGWLGRIILRLWMVFLALCVGSLSFGIVRDEKSKTQAEIRDDSYFTASK